MEKRLVVLKKITRTAATAAKKIFALTGREIDFYQVFQGGGESVFRGKQQENLLRSFIHVFIKFRRFFHKKRRRLKAVIVWFFCLFSFSAKSLPVI